MFFEKQGPVWDTVRELEAKLSDAKIEYVIIGGLALNAHNYPRQTVDVDVVMSAGDLERFRREFEGVSYSRDERLPRRFHDVQTGVTVDVLIAGEIAGDSRRNHCIRFPKPQAAEFHADLRTVSLARLIELKLVTWRFKDWGDVVELIRRNQLSETFSNELDSSVRTAFKECFDQANDPEYES